MTDDKSVVVPEKKEFTPAFFNMQTMTNKTRKLLGCANCEWKDHNMCPHGCTPGITGKSHIPEGICSERLEFFSMFLPPDIKNPTFEEWRRYFNTWQGQTELNHLFAKMKVEERQIKMFEDSLKKKDGLITDNLDNREQLDWLKEQYTETWTKWHHVWETMRGIDTKEVLLDEKYRKKDTNVNVIVSMTDINKAIRDMRKEVVDAEIVK
jgi:hypothetical protein